MTEIRTLKKQYKELFNCIKLTGIGRNKQIIIQEINDIITDINKSKYKYTIILPYISDMDDKTRTICNKYNIKLIYKPTTKLGIYFSNYKSGKIPIELQSDIIYEIPCNDCDKCYRGETARWMMERMKEHKRDIQNMKVKNCVSKHFLEDGHLPNFKQKKILAKESNWMLRRIKENLYIRSDGKSYNAAMGDSKLTFAY